MTGASLSSKIWLMRSFVTSIFLHACESWTLTAELQGRIQAMKMRCYRKILHIQRPCYQRGSPCQDPAGNRITRRPPDYCKETQTAVVWLCLMFNWSGQNHLARHSERGKKTRQTEEEVGRWHLEMDRPGVRQDPEGSWEQGKMGKKLVVKSSVVPQRPSNYTMTCIFPPTILTLWRNVVLRGASKQIACMKIIFFIFKR